MNAKNHEIEVTLPILHSIAEKPNITQRSLSQKLDLALGLTNTYLKQCVKKGLVKIEQAPANRYLYYLTPKGFKEKSRLTKNYIKNSFGQYVILKNEAERLVKSCIENSLGRIAIAGENELAELVHLVFVSHGLNADTMGISPVKQFVNYDVVIITDCDCTESVIRKIKLLLPEDRIHFIGRLDALRK